MEKLAVLLGLVILAGFLPSPLDSKISEKQVKWERRSKRQAPIGILNPPIPTSVAFYTGGNQVIDGCRSDQVLFEDGQCYQLLTQGPCAINQYLILNVDTNKPYCAPRLCSPDRIFIFSDQLCHDPRNSQLCPPGRQLYETMYGTPICQCPDGTYEGDDDLDDDVCDPLLSETLTCPPGQVFWFRDFSLPPECLPDPCGGENLNRGPNDQPFVPFTDGRCFQLGSMPNVCPAQTWYSIALDRLQGTCSSLQDAGYQVFDQAQLARIREIYGPPIARDATSAIPVPTTSPSQVAGGPSIGGVQGVGGTAGGQGPVTGGTGSGNTGNQGFTSQGVSSGGTPGVVQQGFGSGNQGIATGGTGFGNTGNQGFSNQGVISGGTTGFAQQGFGSGHQGTVTGGISSGSTGNQGFSSQGVTSGGTPGFNQQGFGSGNHGTATGGIGLSSTGNQGFSSQGVTSGGTPGVSQQGFGPGNQGTVTGGISLGSTGNQGFSSHGMMSGGIQGTAQQAFAPVNQGTVGGSTNTVSQGSFSPVSQASGFGNQGTTSANQGGQAVLGLGGNQGTSAFRPITFPESSPGQVFSARPAYQDTSVISSLGLTPLSVTHGQPTTHIVNDQSHEMFGLYDDDIPDFRTGAEDLSNLMIREGRLLSHLALPSAGQSDDLSLLQAPQGHKLHGFYNSVRTLVDQGPHNRSRRNALPHASPGNVFEPRLVSCRAGARRDVNAKCRDTILPARIPSRPARAVPPVPPSQSCPAGQAFNIRRMCEATGSALGSVSARGLG